MSGYTLGLRNYFGRDEVSIKYFGHCFGKKALQKMTSLEVDIKTKTAFLFASFYLNLAHLWRLFARQNFVKVHVWR